MCKGYKYFEIYKQTHKLGIDIHYLSLRLPKYELYETGSQIRRSSKSISANIVKGYGRRRYHAEYIRFLIFALSSCDETIEWLEYIKDCYPEFSEATKHLLICANQVGCMLNKFIQAIEKR
ncbi:MAG: four helix bundle protein [bacterium]|nr:four helix bundle protein [bacterium]